MLPLLNRSGALRRLIRPRWIGLVVVQCVMLWSIPQTGIDLPPSGPAAGAALSQTTSQVFTMSAADIYSIREKAATGGARRRSIE